MRAPPVRRERTIRRRMLSLTLAFAAAALLIIALIIAVLSVYISSYSALLSDVTRASQLSENFSRDTEWMDGVHLPNEDDIKSSRRSTEKIYDSAMQEKTYGAGETRKLCVRIMQALVRLELASAPSGQHEQLEKLRLLRLDMFENMDGYIYYETRRLSSIYAAASGRIMVEIFAISALILALVLLLTQRISRMGRSITAPVAELCRRVEEISAGDLAARTPVQAEEYELRLLSHGIEQMAARLDSQIKENTKKQATLRLTELALLQAQINPHFLYNTMDTIIWLIEGDKTREATDMVSNLSDFFRHTLSRGADVISLREEEGHVRSYLQIQQVRYQDIMQYTINIDPRLHELPIPKLTLQPLVENALYHGIKMKRGAGRIYIVGRSDGDDAVLQVTDDGVGMPPERLELLRRAMERQERVGFGLSAVHERLRLFFGPEYGLSVSSQLGVGTTVTARIPADKAATKPET